VLRFLFLIFAFAITATDAFSSVDKTPPRTITVWGTGTVNVKPDMARIRASVTVKEQTSKEALSKK
jgi:uncharacterized protein YggE